jgi:hypothetical protein
MFDTDFYRYIMSGVSYLQVAPLIQNGNASIYFVCFYAIFFALVLALFIAIASMILHSKKKT